MQTIEIRPRREPLLARTTAALKREKARKRRAKLLRKLSSVYPW